MKTLFTLLLTSLVLVSCGKDRNGSTTSTTIPPEIITGNTVEQVDTLEELRDQFDDMSLTVSSGYSSAIGQYNNEGIHKYKYSISGSSLVTSVVDVQSEEVDRFTDSKEEIVDQIFDTSKFGEAESARMETIQLCVVNTNSGAVEQVLGYEITHNLLNGETVTRVVSPDLPLHLNPLHASNTITTGSWWIFDSKSHFGSKTLNRLGLSYLIDYHCDGNF